MYDMTQKIIAMLDGSLILNVIVAIVLSVALLTAANRFWRWATGPALPGRWSAGGEMPEKGDHHGKRSPY